MSLQWNCDIVAGKDKTFSYNPNQETKVRRYQIHDFGIKSLQYKEEEY